MMLEPPMTVGPPRTTVCAVKVVQPARLEHLAQGLQRLRCRGVRIGRWAALGGSRGFSGGNRLAARSLPTPDGVGRPVPSDARTGWPEHCSGRPQPDGPLCPHPPRAGRPLCADAFQPALHNDPAPRGDPPLRRRAPTCARVARTASRQTAGSPPACARAQPSVPLLAPDSVPLFLTGRPGRVPLPVRRRTSGTMRCSSGA